MNVIISEDQFYTVYRKLNLTEEKTRKLVVLLERGQEILTKLTNLSEQKSDQIIDKSVGIESSNMKALGLDPTKPSDRNVYLLKTYGKVLPDVMEDLRSLLFSNVGFAIQLVSVLSGYGAAGVELAWALLLFYDLYLLSSGQGNYWNIVIDILSLLSAGTLSKVLAPFRFGSANSLKSAIGKLTQNGLNKNPIIQKILSNISSYSETILGYFDDIKNLFGKLKGFEWITKKIQKIKESVADILSELTSALISPVGGNITGKSILELNPAKSIALYFTKLPPQLKLDLSKKGIQEIYLKAIDKYIDKLKNTSIEAVLSEIDKQYGSVYTDLFRKYIAAKKYKGQTSKISQNKFGAKDYAADVLTGSGSEEKRSEYIAGVGTD